MKNVFLFLALLCSSLVYGQYFYNDLQGAVAITEKMKSYSVNKVRSVTGAGYDPRGGKNPDFNEWQEVDHIQRKWKVTTRNGQEFSKQTYQFDTQLRLIAIMDSARGATSITSYQYDDNGKIVSIKTVISDTADGFTQSELHQWVYNNQSKPEKMWRIQNGKDSIEYRFTIDEKGNVADEQLYRRGQSIDQVYYYYDENNRLTDIVRYNKKLKKLLPDFMFEYDESNRVIQKITTLSTVRPDYLIWRFIYNEKGLKTKEALFDKDKSLTGRIEYNYTMAQ